MSMSFIAELSPVYCCLVRSVFVFLPVLSVDGFWLMMMMMMMMAMTICFTEATRLLESTAGGRATIQNELGKDTMCSENVQCAMKIYNYNFNDNSTL